MKLIALFLIAGSLSALAATEEQLNKRFPIESGGRLIVDIEFGSILVNTNSTGEVVADVWRKVGRKNEAAEQSYLKDTAVEFVQEGTTMTIRSRSKKPLSSINWSGANRNEARYTISVPPKFSLQLATSGGSVAANNVTGETKANTSGGSLGFSSLHGPLRAETSGGSIRVDSCEGKLWVHTSGGSIKVSGGSGSLDGETSGGSISVKDFKGSAHVGTSGGGITMENIDGDIVGSTSGGSIHGVLKAPLPGTVKLETSGGGIAIRAPGTVAFDLDASTSAGGVRSDFAVVGANAKKRDQLHGTVNGGGKSVFLRTSAGGIDIKKD